MNKMAQYTTQELIKAELQTTTDFSGNTIPSLTQVTTWINEASKKADLYAGRTFGDASYSEIIDYNGDDYITLTHAPVISVDSILYTTASIGTANYGLTETATENVDYAVYEDSGEILVLSNKFKVGNKSVKINYTAGFNTIPENVQELTTKMVAKRILDSSVQSNMNEGNVGGSISVGNINIVEPDNLSIATYKVLNDEIQRLINELKTASGVYRYSRW